MGKCPVKLDILLMQLIKQRPMAILIAPNQDKRCLPMAGRAQRQPAGWTQVLSCRLVLLNCLESIYDTLPLIPNQCALFPTWQVLCIGSVMASWPGTFVCLVVPLLLSCGYDANFGPINVSTCADWNIDQNQHCEWLCEQNHLEHKNGSTTLIRCPLIKHIRSHMPYAIDLTT